MENFDAITATAAMDAVTTTTSSKKDNNEVKCIYLDYNGTTPIYPQVLEAMLPYFTTHFGNPSSSHHYGAEPKAAIGRARRSLLNLLRTQPNSNGATDDNDSDGDASCMLFTGCGTESNNLAIRLALLSVIAADDAETSLILHVVTSNVEHPAIVQCLAAYSSGGQLGGICKTIEITEVPVNSEGIVSAADVENAIRGGGSADTTRTALVTIMTANNESGAVQPVREIAKMCRERGVLFHTDAAQAVGKMDLRGLADNDSANDGLGCDMVTLVGHKFGAPKGVAALYIRPDCLSQHGRICPIGSVLLMGGGQEFGRRGGTENVPYMVGMGRAAEMLLEKDEGAAVMERWEANAIHMERMRNRLLQNLIRGFDDDDATAIVRPNGPRDSKLRLPNTLSVGLKGIKSGNLLQNIGHVVACSAGSACHSSSSSCSNGGGGDVVSYSSILKAMKVSPEYAVGTLRLTVGPDTNEEDVDRAAEIIVAEAMRQLEEGR